jgi:hypothetical protein
MAVRKKSSTSVGAIERKIKTVSEQTKKVLAAKRAIEKKETLQKRLMQKITALEKAKNALKISGLKARKTKKRK